MDIRCLWIEEEYLGIGELFLLWLLGLRFECRVYDEDRPNLHFAKDILHVY